MNKDQRKYLADQVTKTYQTEFKRIQETKQKEPSLNNYLIAAVLDGSLIMKSMAAVKESIHKRVLAMGRDDVLIKSTKRRGFYDDEEEGDHITLPADVLFEYPAAYHAALKAVEEHNAKVDEELKQLEAHYKTVSLKVQIGSDKALEKLIAEVDNLADLSIMNNHLTLTNAPASKQVGNG